MLKWQKLHSPAKDPYSTLADGYWGGDGTSSLVYRLTESSGKKAASGEVQEVSSTAQGNLWTGRGLRGRPLKAHNRSPRQECGKFWLMVTGEEMAPPAWSIDLQSPVGKKQPQERYRKSAALPRATSGQAEGLEAGL
ncbi:hypothetical protein H920_18815 [Fukomys damarensis]|uniref:Uncharacterized protein n=1 Tax=Fukomys damarensis TaxID=885580 RepID=A0A091DAH8_FUKDA|nr:hypothetical protein H920_18815 [Fukomys damarensis]